jgi:hypothetical protein
MGAGELLSTLAGAFGRPLVTAPLTLLTPFAPNAYQEQAVPD